MTRRPAADGTPSRVVAGSSVVVGALCLSVSAILVKVAGVDAATTAMLRCAIAVLLLVPLAVVEGSRRGRLSRQGTGWAIAAGVGLGVDYAAWTAAIYLVGAGVSTVLINVQVVVLPLLAFVVDRERIPARFLAALPLMLVGITAVGGVWERRELGEQAVAGTLLGLLAGLGYGVYLFLARRATRREPGRMMQPLTWSTAAAAATTTAIAPVSGGLHLAEVGARSWALLALLAVLGQVIAWLLIHHGSVRLRPSTTATLLLIQPVLALGLSAVVLAERPTPLQLIGAAVVLGAVALSSGSARAPVVHRGRAVAQRLG